MGQRAEAMEQHGRELDNQDEREEEHKHETDRLQLEVFFRDVDLGCALVSGDSKKETQKKKEMR